VASGAAAARRGLMSVQADSGRIALIRPVAGAVQPDGRRFRRAAASLHRGERRKDCQSRQVTWVLGFVSARSTGDDGTVEMLAELGEDRLDTADCLA
jgi:hypothetical protein